MSGNISRQVHLDFHCSEFINSIGKEFDKEKFQWHLNSAKIKSINLFAKCHHSWSYYPTKIGKIHPGLGFDLLGSQIEACHEIGIKTPFYYTVGWSEGDANAHPEWCVRDKNGSILSSAEENNNSPFEYPAFKWRFLCVNTAYHDLIYNQVDEICKRYPIDGFWFDIYQVYRLCFCEKCKDQMKRESVDLKDIFQVQAFNAKVIKRHCSSLKDLIYGHNKSASVFFNGTTAVDSGLNFKHKMYEFNTIQDLEDLPTTWGGYDKLPLQAKYFMKMGFPITAMSGKFHTAWGEFGGFKHQDAMKYEAASMISYGANCNFGDQLHPNGEIDESTYKIISFAFDYVSQFEQYNVGIVSFSLLGIWRSFDEESDEGLVRILLENQLDFDIANFDAENAFSQFELLLIPSKAEFSNNEVKALNDFIENGGKIIAMGDSLLSEDEDYIIDVGLSYKGKSKYDCDYTCAGENINQGIVESKFLNYLPANINSVNGCEVLAELYEPFFSRTSEHYCSHQNTPPKEVKASHPAIVKKGNIFYCAHSLDIMYYRYGARLHRDIYSNLIRFTKYRPFVNLDLPSTGRINILHNKANSAFLLHILSSNPIQRGACSVIEDFITLFNTKISFNFPYKIKQVILEPGNKKLEVIKKRDNYSIIIPKINCHCLVVFKY